MYYAVSLIDISRFGERVFAEWVFSSFRSREGSGAGFTDVVFTVVLQYSCNM